MNGWRPAHRRRLGGGLYSHGGFGTMSLAACGGGDHLPSLRRRRHPHLSRSAAVAKTSWTASTVPAGYRQHGHLRHERQSTPGCEQRHAGQLCPLNSGDHHDGMHFFGLTAAGARSTSSNDRALLVMGNENILHL
jgi:hypothetical protein